MRILLELQVVLHPKHKGIPHGRESARKKEEEDKEEDDIEEAEDDIDIEDDGIDIEIEDGGINFQHSADSPVEPQSSS